MTGQEKLADLRQKNIAYLRAAWEDANRMLPPDEWQECPYAGDGIPKLYRQWTLDNYSAAWSGVAAEFLCGPSSVWSFLITGAFGSRKTSFACAVLRAWRDSWSADVANWHGPESAYSTGKDYGIFLPAYEAAERLRDLEHKAESLAQWQATNFLVLDDLGANRATPHIKEQLLFLLQFRYDECKKTVITSNLDLDGIRGEIDQRVSSRLQEGLYRKLGAKDLRGT